MTDRRRADSRSRPPSARAAGGAGGRARSVPTGSGASTPRDVARFLVALKPIVARAVEVRQSWVRELGLLFEEARQGNEVQVVGRAGRLGRDHLVALREVRWAAESERPPEGCQDIHRSLMTWLDGLVRACEALIEVGTSGQIAGVNAVQRHVADARYAAKRFNGEYTRLVTELRVAVRSARR